MTLEQLKKKLPFAGYYYDYPQTYPQDVDKGERTVRIFFFLIYKRYIEQRFSPTT